MTDQEQYLKLYELYLNRVMKEADLIWTRFKIFLTLNSGIAILLGFISKNSIEESKFINLQSSVSLIVISALGIVITRSWTVINKGGYFWQEFFCKQLSRVEEKLDLEGINSYTEILKITKEETEMKKGIMDINIQLTSIFLVFWCLCFVFSVGVVLYQFFIYLTFCKSIL